MVRPYRIFVSPWGNSFMRELAELLGAALADLARDVAILGDGLPDGSGSTVDLVVAPQDYFVLGRHDDEAATWRAVEASVAIATEQPGTVWFDRSLPYLAASRLVLDLDTLAVDRLRGAGVVARRLRLGYHPSWDRWGGHTEAPRPVDVAFLGALTDRRERFLADAAPRLWDRRCDLRLFEITRPKQPGDAGFFTGADKWDRLAATKLLVNVHRSEAPYFEWLRALDALANGCVLVSEPSLDADPLVPGRHFVHAPVDLLTDYAIGLLADPSQLQQISAEAYDLVRSELRMTDLLRPLLDEIESPAPGSSHGTPAPTAPATTHATPDPVVDRVRQTERSVGFWVKQLLLAEQDLQRRLDAVETCLVVFEERHEEVTATPAWATVEADVSVVIPLHEHEAFVDETISSVLASTGVAVEIVVVDDRSRDGSAEVVQGRMAKDPDVPIALVTKFANEGLPAARNSGFAVARAPLVFLLDADDTVYPTGLAKLRAALVDSDHAFAYGLLDRFGARPGIENALPWDPERLALGNYICATALIRRTAWEAVGGFDEAMVAFGGWEDYDLWLRFAAAGRSGVLVPEFVARYRTHATADGSMLSVFNLDVSLPTAHLRARYPELPWPTT